MYLQSYSLFSIEIPLCAILLLQLGKETPSRETQRESFVLKWLKLWRIPLIWLTQTA